MKNYTIQYEEKRIAFVDDEAESEEALKKVEEIKCNGEIDSQVLHIVNSSCKIVCEGGAKHLWNAKM
jgi:hypothetical protein